MEIKLLHIASLELVIRAIRMCYQSFDNSDSYYTTNYNAYEEKHFHLGEKDKALINRIIESGHHSTLEHINITVEVTGWSRLLLQELARHRIASYSIKSTRYTLKELKDEEPFCCNIHQGDYDQIIKWDSDRANKYINFSGNALVDTESIFALERLRKLVSSDISNDITKYVLPECYKFDGIITMNIRSLRNFLKLRTDKRAHFEIRKFAYALYNALPEEYKFLVDDCVYKEII